MLAAMRALVADVGGTKTDLALYEGERGATPVRLGRAHVPTTDASGLMHAINDLRGAESLDVAVIAAAGPLAGDRIQLTNLPWAIDRHALELALGTHVSLINDVAALALALPALRDEHVAWLNPRPCAAQGPWAILALGTGLGAAVSVRAGRDTVAIAGEGGHADFAARNPIEARLSERLRARYGHVSKERVLSGPGLAELHQLSCLEAGEPDPGLLDPPLITERALEGEAACERTLGLFLSLCGAAAGDLALNVLPRGGMFLGGGVARRLAQRMQRGEVLAGFIDKGRMGSLLAELPLGVIVLEDATLLGAWERACFIAQRG
jgi:glucokinase